MSRTCSAAPRAAPAGDYFLLSQLRAWALRQPRRPAPHVDSGWRRGDPGRSLTLAPGYPTGRGSRPPSLSKATPEPGIPPRIPRSSYRGLHVPVPGCIRGPLPRTRSVLPEVCSGNSRDSSCQQLVEGSPPPPRDGAWEMVTSLGRHSPESREDRLLPGTRSSTKVG